MQINMNHWAKYESSSITIKAQWRYLAYCSVPFKSWLRAAKTSGPRLLRACPCARMKLSVSSIKWPETPPENFSTNPNIMGHVIANVGLDLSTAVFTSFHVMTVLPWPIWATTAAQIFRRSWSSDSERLRCEATFMEDCSRCGSSGNSWSTWLLTTSHGRPSVQAAW